MASDFLKGQLVMINHLTVVLSSHVLPTFSIIDHCSYSEEVCDFCCKFSLQVFFLPKRWQLGALTWYTVRAIRDTLFSLSLCSICSREIPFQPVFGPLIICRWCMFTWIPIPSLTFARRIFHYYYTVACTVDCSKRSLHYFPSKVISITLPLPSLNLLRNFKNYFRAHFKTRF